MTLAVASSDNVIIEMEGQMTYFFINLAFHLMISVVLFIILRHFFINDQQRKNKVWISYFFPVVASIILLTQASYFTFPRVLASAEMIRNDFSLQTGTVEEVGFLNNKLVIEGEKYYFNPMIYKPKEGDSLIYQSTNYARYIVKMSVSDTAQ